MSDKSDHELVAEAIRGVHSAFGILVERYQKPIYRMILQMTDDRETAKDLTQDVFLKAYTKLTQFNPSYRFFSWIYRIALNETLNNLASRKYHLSLDPLINQPAPEEATSPSAIQENLLKQALRELKPLHRSLILLKYYSGLSYSEMSVSTGISENKVKDRLFNARMALRKRLTDLRYFDYD